MVQAEKAENTEFIEKAVNYIKAKGYEYIKADIEGYETPKTFRRKGTDGFITPDIEAEKNGRTYFFDISLKSEDPSLLKTKWLFLESLSKMKSGTFRVITTKGHFKFTDTMLEDIHLENKTPIKI
ncbi:hypothetical protein N8328_01825 [Crocinitomicaceae bacterium]|jgi:hypothetical protein|nr:hypothetical protein [Crocinitomicaceae bacterium]